MGATTWRSPQSSGGLYGHEEEQQAADELEKYLKLDPKAPDAERIEDDQLRSSSRSWDRRRLACMVRE